MTTQQQTANSFEIVKCNTLVPPLKSFLFGNEIFLPENATEADIQTAVELYSKPEEELLQMKDVCTKVNNTLYIITH